MAVSALGAASSLPALSLFLLVISASSPSASAQRFDLSQLSLRAAAEAQAGTSGYFNCPEQVRNEEAVLRRRLNRCPRQNSGLSCNCYFLINSRMGDGTEEILHSLTYILCCARLS